MKGGLSRWGEQAEKIWVNFGDAAGKAFDGIGDNLADMLTGATVDWKAFAASFLRELLAMMIKMEMAIVLKAILGGWGGTGFGQTPITGASAETPEFADGGIAWTPQLAKVGEKEPELITPFSKLKSLIGNSPQPNINIKAIFVRDETEAQLEVMRSPAGEKIIVQKVARNRRSLG